MTTKDIIDRDLAYYEAALASEDKNSPLDSREWDCFCAARVLVITLRNYRDALKAAGRLETTS